MEQRATLRIAISGSGSAGPTAAALLAKAGHEVTLFERAPRQLPVGAGFLLQPTGMSVLERLGILDELLPQTARIDQLYCRNLAGSTLLDLSYADLAPELFGAGTHRATLLSLLLKSANEAGAEILWDHSIQKLERESSGLSRLTDSHGRTHGPYDLTLICDGSKSTLREQTGIPTRVDRYPWGALWFIGKRTAEFDPHTLWQSVHTTRFLNGFLPTGTAEDLLSLFWSVRVDQMDHWRSQNLDSWRSQVLRLAPQSESFLAQIEDLSDLQPATYYDVRMKRWDAPGIVVLGDAAHALSPQLGQGVNLALMDAATLTDCLAELPLDQALVAYTKRRRKHLKFYQFATRWTTPFFQSDYPMLGKVRDLGFPIGNKIPWFRKQMTATMAGLKTGPFSQL